MITLAADCLLFELANGESVPFSAEMVSVELEGDTELWFDAEFVRHAAKAVFHYFKEELGRQTVTIGEFTGALEKVMRGFKPACRGLDQARADASVLESDLGRLARESSGGCELIFFPRLRDELRLKLQQRPRQVRFHGLRGCVKQLVGARRWTVRCRGLEEQIVAYLRECLRAEPPQADCSIVVE